MDNGYNPFDAQGQNESPFGFTPMPIKDRHLGLAFMALFTGIMGVFFGVVGLPINGIAIVLAFLSRGNGRMRLPAMIGAVLGTIGTMIAIYSVTFTLIHLPQIIETPAFQQAAETLYGDDADVYLQQIKDLYGMK